MYMENVQLGLLRSHSIGIEEQTGHEQCCSAYVGDPSRQLKTNFVAVRQPVALKQDKNGFDSVIFRRIRKDKDGFGPYR